MFGAKSAYSATPPECDRDNRTDYLTENSVGIVSWSVFTANVKADAHQSLRSVEEDLP